ncbi:MAG TPA: hypothetical protein VKT12_05975, partial [Candidatus Binataceae bacterium]|nr:hypothetical protein [Candidatus Binataceae bacterium]
RVLVTFVAGMAEPRRIVRITSGDIAQRNEAERSDWQRRGVAGIVTGKTENEVALELRTPQGAQTIHLAVSRKTAIRRYAPDSVKFTDAQPSELAEISVGDQLRARGTKNQDGSRIEAEDIVFGTFLTMLGPITAVDREAGEVHIRDLAANAPVTIRLTNESRVKRAPDMREMFGHATKAPPASAPAGMAEMLEGLPACRIDDLKVGSTLVVTATRSARAGAVTAVMLIANIDSLIQMAQAETGDKNASPMKSLSALHHGMFEGPGGGFSLPAILP